MKRVIWLVVGLLALASPAGAQVFGGMPGPKTYRAAISSSEGSHTALFQARIADPLLISVSRSLEARHDRFELWIPLYTRNRTHNLLPVLSADGATNDLSWRIHYTFRQEAWHANLSYDRGARVSAGAWIARRVLPVPEVHLSDSGELTFAANLRVMLVGPNWLQARYSGGVSSLGLFLHW